MIQNGTLDRLFVLRFDIPVIGLLGTSGFSFSHWSFFHIALKEKKLMMLWMKKTVKIKHNPVYQILKNMVRFTFVVLWMFFFLLCHLVPISMEQQEFGFKFVSYVFLLFIFYFFKICSYVTFYTVPIFLDNLLTFRWFYTSC